MFQRNLECLITNHLKTSKRYNIHIINVSSAQFATSISVLFRNYLSLKNNKNIPFLSLLCFKPIYFNTENSGRPQKDWNLEMESYKETHAWPCSVSYSCFLLHVWFILISADSFCLLLVLPDKIWPFRVEYGC